MLEKPSRQPARFIFGRNHAHGLPAVLSRNAAELCEFVDASGCCLYTLGENQSFVPLTLGGTIAGPERELFFSTTLSTETDALARHMLAHPSSVVYERSAGDQQLASSSIFGVLQARSALVVPILNGSELLGLLLLVRTDKPDGFSEAVIRQVEWFGSSIAVALDNVRMYHQSLELLAENEALHQITLAILQKLELDEVLKIVCDEAQKMTDADGGSIALLETNSWMRIMYCAGESPDKPGRLRASRSHLGRAIHHRSEPLIIHRPADRSEAMSRLAIPLQVRNNTIGLLTLFRRTDFDADNARLMHIFAGQAAIAIDHAQLTRMVQEMAILEERHRLSRELHDSVNQLLYGISLYTEAALRQLDQGNLDAAKRYLKNIEESDQAALKEMRMLIFGLRPSGLTQMGLQASLAQRLKSVEEKLGLQPSFKWRIISHLEPDVEEMLYGIAQEALNNVIRHANARTVSVRLAESEEHITMTIKDDGNGFEPETVSTGGMGLKTMRERAANQNARLKIDSQPGQGTRITVEVAL
jgi:signal transduction histidine kinase